MAYATVADLAACDFLSDGLTLPSTGQQERLLSRASREIDKALLRAFYQVDHDGQPTDAKVVTALRDATCAQACWWLETGDEAGAVASVGGHSTGGGPVVSGPVPRLAPDAETVLRMAVDSGGNPLLTGPWSA